MSMLLSIVACLILHIVLGSSIVVVVICRHCHITSSLSAYLHHHCVAIIRCCHQCQGWQRVRGWCGSGCYDGCWALWLLDRRKRVVGHYSPALCMLSSPSGWHGTSQGDHWGLLHAPSTEQALIVAVVVGVCACADPPACEVAVDVCRLAHGGCSRCKVVDTKAGGWWGWWWKESGVCIWFWVVFVFDYKLCLCLLVL